jgi:hypothetical protein
MTILKKRPRDFIQAAKLVVDTQTTKLSLAATRGHIDRSAGKI